MNMSFALTTRQIESEQKTVTRRLGWTRAKVGQIVQPIVKGQGLKKGERVTKIGRRIRFTDVRRERLDRMTTDQDYGRAECAKEGFSDLTPAEFVYMFCRSHRWPALYAAGALVEGARSCLPDDEVTRIEFEYVEIEA
jgi:hypothetical protein